MKKFDREQLVLMVDTCIRSAWDVIQGCLPSGGPKDAAKWRRESGKDMIHGAKQVFAHFVPILFASTHDDGMGIGEFVGWTRFEQLVDSFVEGVKHTGELGTGPDLDKLAEEIVDTEFSDYLSPYSDEGLEFDDGSVLQWPDEDGTIRLIDGFGNTVEVWHEGDDGWNEQRDRFPDDALYFQPDRAGDPEGDTSATKIKSFEVYRNYANAQAAHPDCEILGFIGQDIQNPHFLDVEKPKLFWNKPA